MFLAERRPERPVTRVAPSEGRRATRVLIMLIVIETFVTREITMAFGCGGRLGHRLVDQRARR
jgi:hypothetical protein